jgi:hypothetical protein
MSMIFYLMIQEQNHLVGGLLESWRWIFRSRGGLIVRGKGERVIRYELAHSMLDYID